MRGKPASEKWERQEVTGDATYGGEWMGLGN